MEITNPWKVLSNDRVISCLTMTENDKVRLERQECDD